MSKNISLIGSEMLYAVSPRSLIHFLSNGLNLPIRNPFTHRSGFTPANHKSVKIEKVLLIPAKLTTNEDTNIATWVAISNPVLESTSTNMR